MYGEASNSDDSADFDAATVDLERLDGYVLHERIGEGGMGIVHRAVDGRGGVVAVKLLRPQVASDAESRARFAREAQVLSRVKGAHIAEVLDANVVAETPYLVTRYVHGPPLFDVVRHEGPLQGGDLADLAGDLADALRSVHAAGIVHRDLKPANVLLQPTDQGRVAMVIDFGIAQLADETRMTMTGLVYGTPGYVAPEVLTGRDIDPVSDIHAWAATVTYAATGRHPFGNGPLEAVAFRVLQDEPDLQGCPDWLVPVLRRCFAKDPALRPNAAELLHWLETGEPPPQRQPSQSPPPPEPKFQPTVVFPGAEPPPAQPVGPPAQSGYPPPEPAREPVGSWAPQQGGPASPRRRPELSRTVRLTVLGAWVVVAALAANAPGIATVLVAGWLVLARTVDRSTQFLRGRRFQTGGRTSDGVVTTLAVPWHAGMAGLSTLLTLPIAILGAAIVGVAVAAVWHASGSELWLDVLLAFGGLLGLVFAWWGLDGESLRTGTRQLLGGVLLRPPQPAQPTQQPRPGVVAAVCVVCGLLVLVLAGIAVGNPPIWWPLEQVTEDVRDRLSDTLQMN